MSEGGCIFQDCTSESEYTYNVRGESYCPVHYMEKFGQGAEELAKELNGYIEIKKYVISLTFNKPTITYNDTKYEFDPITFDVEPYLNRISIRGNSDEDSGHPHISSDGGLCMGAFGDTLYDKVKNGRFLEFITTACACVNTYTSRDSYHKIDQCQNGCDDDWRYICPTCGNRVCDECYREEDNVCQDCMTAECGSCGKRMNDEEAKEAKTCEKCGDKLCEECAFTEQYERYAGRYNDEGRYYYEKNIFYRVVCNIHRSTNS